MARNNALAVSGSKLPDHSAVPMILPACIGIQQAFGELGHTPGGGGLVGKVSGIPQVEGLDYTWGAAYLTDCRNCGKAPGVDSCLSRCTAPVEGCTHGLEITPMCDIERTIRPNARKRLRWRGLPVQQIPSSIRLRTVSRPRRRRCAVVLLPDRGCVQGLARTRGSW